MPRKKKIETVTQAHAKEPTYALTTIDQLWSHNPSSRYDTMDESVYAARLRDMTRADLENHARQVGCLVVEDNDRLKNELMKLFRAHVLSFRKPVEPVRQPQQVSEAVRRILAEGR